MAAGERGIHRPLRNVSMNGYGAIHAELYTDRATLSQWMRETASDPDERRPGTLTFYLGP